MSQEYLNLIHKHFHNSSSLDDFNFAKEFLLNFSCYSSNIKDEITRDTSNTYNICAAAKQTPLSFLTKRIPLVADSSVFTHLGKYSTFHTSRTGVYEEDAQERRYQSTCDNLEELGKWLKSSLPMLESGDLIYYPQISSAQYVSEGPWNSAGDYSNWKESHLSPKINDELVDLVLEKRNVSEILTRNHTKSSLIQPIVQLELPYIENTDLATFCKIMADHPENLAQFRDLIRLKLFETTWGEDDDQLQAKLSKLSIEMRDGVRQIEDKMRIIKRKAWFGATSAVLATATALLVAVNSGIMSILPKVLGAGGGAFLMLKAAEDYTIQRSKIEGMPYYFIWLFHDK